VSIGITGPAIAQVPAAGDIIVLEQGDTEHSVPAALIRINPASGEQVAISGGNLLSDAIGENPNGFVFDRFARQFLVVDRAGKVVRIDPASGAQELVTDGLADPTAVEVEAPNQYLITEYGGDLLRFDSGQGTVSVLAAGGLIGGIAPWAVHVHEDGTIIVAGLTAGGNDVPGPPSRVIMVDPASGMQSLVAEITDGQFRDFALTTTDAFIAIGSRGYPAGADMVARLDLSTGTIVPVVTGLQRALDVDFTPGGGNLIILDQVLSLPCCPPWVPRVE
jgi:hypothetical protein